MKVSFEGKGGFDNIGNWLSSVVKRSPAQTLSKIARDGEEALAANTPKDTGETASGWVSEITTNGDTSEIAWKNVAHPEASVNVAKLIEVGHGTGNGGYVQPKPYIKEAMKPVWKNVTDKAVKELIK